MKKLLISLLLVIGIGSAGLVYRNAAEHPSKQIACPMDARICPDGTAVSRVGSSCTFSECPLPNISLPDVKISFALPAGFSPLEAPDETMVAVYALSPVASSTGTASIVIRRYAISASSTPLEVIQETAIGGASGIPVSATSFTSTVLGGYRFTVVSIERFEGTIDTAYYLAHGTDVLRFDAIDDQNPAWMDPNLNVASLPAHSALQKLLITLQGQ